jgi:hypothetical protein
MPLPKRPRTPRNHNDDRRRFTQARWRKDYYQVLGDRKGSRDFSAILASGSLNKCVLGPFERNRNTFRMLRLLFWSLLLHESTAGLFQSHRERIRLEKQASEAYHALREHGVDAVGHTEEAAKLREYRLRKKKRKGLLRKKASLASVLFPGVSPEVYTDGEEVFAITDMVQSKKTHVPFDFYETMPGCERDPMTNFKRKRKRHQRKNLGARLQGLELQPAPYKLNVHRDIPCTGRS